MKRRSPRDRSRNLVERWFDAVHRHVCLVYPFAHTDQVVQEVFRRAVSEDRPIAAPGERAWVLRLVRDVVYSTATDGEMFRRRNSEAVAFGLRDAVAHVDPRSHSAALGAVAALGLLPSDQQEIIRLHTVESLDVEEMAWILDEDPVAARSAIDQASSLLRDAAAAEAARVERGDSDG